MQNGVGRAAHAQPRGATITMTTRRVRRLNPDDQEKFAQRQQRFPKVVKVLNTVLSARDAVYKQQRSLNKGFRQARPKRSRKAI